MAAVWALRQLLEAVQRLHGDVPLEPAPRDPLLYEPITDVPPRHLHRFTSRAVIERRVRVANHGVRHDALAEITRAPVDGVVRLAGDEVQPRRGRQAEGGVETVHRAGQLPAGRIRLACDGEVTAA